MELIVERDGKRFLMDRAGNALPLLDEPQGTLSAYEPTVTERWRWGLADALRDKLGMSTYGARDISELILGKPFAGPETDALTGFLDGMGIAGATGFSAIPEGLQAVEDYQRGNYGDAALGGIFSAIEAIPVIGAGARLLRRGVSRGASGLRGLLDDAPLLGTHEAQPYVGSWHLPLSSEATRAERLAYASDPRSDWIDAETGGDVLYSAAFGSTSPTTRMQGVYDPPGAAREFNPGWVARVPGVSLADREPDVIAAETLRAALDVQGATPAHRAIRDPLGSSLVLPRGEMRPASISEINVAGRVGGAMGRPDVVDTGSGFTVTRFYPEPEGVPQAGLLSDFPGHGAPYRARVESTYPGLEEEWAMPHGSGAVSGRVLSALDGASPQVRAALDADPRIPSVAAARSARDAEWAERWGGTRADVENLRRIVASGPGWQARLRDAVAAGAVLPAIAVAFMSQPPEGGI